MHYTNKTQPTKISPEKFLKENFKGNEKVQSEALALVELYTKATGAPCVMWNKIFGFGKYYYLDSKGGEHSYLMAGFAISKTGFTLYNLLGWAAYKEELEKLGKYKLTGKSCLAIKSVGDIKPTVLKTIIKKSVSGINQKYKTEK